MSRSVFIKAMHPKTEISPSLASVEKILKLGWVGQMKIHGHRAQIHLSADPSEEAIAYNRQGRPHKMLLPDTIVEELRRVLNLKIGWTVLDAEWLKPESKLFIFDVLKLDGKLLRTMSYPERYKLLPRLYISKYLQTLPLLTTPAKCMEVLARSEEHIEGLVFKSSTTKGFEDTSIVRCRKKTSRA
ncbi:MAG: hypothetical protein K2X47_08325 [Bdellovibrionales bacterium]|nr:hypothetical protein [Bdellovibrionales bacterium]